MNIPIVFAINDKYVKQLTTTITSILENSNNNNTYEFHIMNYDISEVNKNIIISYVSKYKNSRINFIDMNSILANLNLEQFMSRRDNYKYISIETYFRFFIPEIFKNYDKVIYLDADLIVLRDIADLFAEKIDEYYCAAVVDKFMENSLKSDANKTSQYKHLSYRQYFKTILNKKNDLYFNAGVLLLNVKKLIEDNISDKLWNFVKEKSPLEFQDQDALNSICEEKVKYIDIKWNILKRKNDNVTSAFIYHFIGPEKPWGNDKSSYKYNYSYINEWWHLYKKTPYFNNSDLRILNMIKRKTQFAKLQTFMQSIFSLNNDGDFKILKILGFEFKFRRKPKKIKVGLIIDEFFGGAGTAYGGYGFLARKYVAKYIPNEDIEIDVLLGRGSKNKFFAKKYHEDDVDLYYLPKRKFASELWLKKQKYDIYLSIELTTNWILKCDKDARKKLILWIQDPRPKSAWDNVIDTMQSIKDPCFYNQKVYDIAHNWAIKNRVKFISQGYSLNPLAMELYNLPAETPIQYLPNPIDIDFEFEFDITKKKKQIIFLGRLEAQKRAWLFCEIAKKMPEYEFYVLGQYFRHKEDNKRMLEKYENDNIPNLHFVGHIDGDKKQNLIKESRILLSTAIWEGIPISWLEALSYGTVLVSDLERESLAEQFGIFVGTVPGDGFDGIDKFIPAIREIMENDEFYSNKAVQAIEYVRNTHNIKRFVNDMREVIIKEV